MDTRLKLREGEGKTKFYWSEETLNHFKEPKGLCPETINQTVKEITKFVEESCDLEDGETVEDLVVDLLAQVFTK